MPRSKKANKNKLHKSSEGFASEKKLDKLIEYTSNLIFEAQTARALDPFPNKIAISPNRVTLTYKTLFSTYEYPLPIENVIGARISSGRVFSNLYIMTFGLTEPEPLKNMLNRDARLARRYILALVECKKNGVDLMDYGIMELRDKLKNLGAVRHDSSRLEEL